MTPLLHIAWTSMGERPRNHNTPRHVQHLVQKSKWLKVHSTMLYRSCKTVEIRSTMLC
jgi:hypothetical protein